MEASLNQAQEIIDKRMREVYYLSLVNVVIVVALFIYMLFFS